MWRRFNVCGGLLLGLLLAAGCAREASEPLRTAAAVRGGIRMTLPFQGELEARRMETVSVGLQGAAILTELVPEGTHVEAGDLLARFDSSKIEQELVQQENEEIRVRQELESLEKGQLPLEILELEAARMDAQTELEAEERFLESARSLRQRGLMSEEEVEQQEEKVEGLRARAKQAETRVDLTRRHVHVARLTQARAALKAAEDQRQYTAHELEECEVRAPKEGVAIRIPLQVGRQYRTAQVGDTLYRNQVFLCLPDPSEHVIRGYIGEAELAHVKPGCPVAAVPVAFPHLCLSGRVEKVGGMGQTLPEQPVWRKFFPVLIALDPLPETMPVGITVRADIVAGEATDALLVPRTALMWTEGEPRVRRVSADGEVETVPVRIGLISDVQAEVLEGLKEGDRVVLP